jgi:hypothetical protein
MRANQGAGRAIDANDQQFGFDAQLQSLSIVALLVYSAELGHELAKRRIN